MANEISISTTLKYAKNKAAASLATSFLASQTGDKYEAGIVSIATTETILDKGGVGTIGYIAIRNIDATNYVQVGSATGAYSVKLLPGEGMVTPWQHVNAYLLANTAAVEVEYLVIEA